MVEKLYIRLGSQAQDEIHWLVSTNSSNEIIASGVLAGAEQLIDIQDKAKQREVVVFVPSCDIAIKSLNIPAKSSKAMRLAAPFMLEDELAQDVEQLFFAYASPKLGTEQQNCFLAAVEREQIQAWISWLNNAGISCKTMIPDMLAMPVSDEHWSVVQLGEQVIIRQGIWQGQTIDRHLLALVSPSWKKHDSGAPVFKCYSKIDELLSFEHDIELTELPLALLAEHSDEAPINLLQEEFAVKSTQSPALNSWLWVAGLAAFALLLNFVLKTVHLWQLESQQVAIESRIISSYKTAFPNAKRVRVATIRSQLKRKLSEVNTSSSGGDNFLPMLSSLQPALKAVPKLKPETLKYDARRNEIRMQASADDYQVFDQLKKRLEEQSLKVTVGSQNNNGNSITGSFSISNSKERS